MNPFSDENLTRALREATGSSPDPDSSPTCSGVEEAHHLKTELESLHNFPLGKIGRKLYRLMIKQWPKPDNNYDWVYEPGALELIPIEKASVLSAANKLSSSHATATKVTPLAVASISDLAPATSNVAELSIGVDSQEEELADFRAGNALSEGKGDDELVRRWQRESPVLIMLGEKLTAPKKLIPRFDVLTGQDGNYNFKLPDLRDICSLEYLDSKSIEERSHALELPLLESYNLTVIPFEKKLKWVNGLSGVSMRGGVRINPPSAGRISCVLDQIFSSEQFDGRVLFTEEAHHARITSVAEIELVLQTMNSALTTFQSRMAVGCTASPKNPFHAAVDFVMGIFKPKENQSQTIKGCHDSGAGEFESVEWRIDVDPSSDLALKGSAGHFRDYWFKLQNHQLSLKWQDKAGQRHPETIFLVGDAEPERAGAMMVTAFEDAHVGQERAMRLIGSLKDFVERQARVH